ncbi:hypothetical protein HDU85_001301 [Gaertneriomyces sp. JEL0708]|nr:hypothetical protein HDU85_001301 [Gaertneriomyces sp. JEL0708]
MTLAPSLITYVSSSTNQEVKTKVYWLFVRVARDLLTVKLVVDDGLPVDPTDVVGSAHEVKPNVVPLPAAKAAKVVLAPIVAAHLENVLDAETAVLADVRQMDPYMAVNISPLGLVTCVHDGNKNFAINNRSGVNAKESLNLKQASMDLAYE